MTNHKNDRQYDFWHKDPSNWRGGIFYFNRRDPRIMVPKRNPIMGWTPNFGNPVSWIILASIAILTTIGSKLF